MLFPAWTVFASFPLLPFAATLFLGLWKIVKFDTGYSVITPLLYLAKVHILYIKLK